MNKRQTLITGIALALLGGVALKSAFSVSPAPTHPATPVFAQNDWKPPVSDVEPLTIAANTNTPPAPETTQAAGNDGKTELPTDGKTVLPTDGKELLPYSGKEALPPVGQFINSQPQNVDPSQVGPPTEYKNLANPLLRAPSPTNVSGPVVSAETP
jgi:hypothetical protein